MREAILDDLETTEKETTEDVEVLFGRNKDTAKTESQVEKMTLVSSKNVVFSVL